MVTEDLVNLMEDDVSAKEAIDVKKGRKKKESRCEPAMSGKKGGGANVIKERNRSEKLLVFDVTTQSIGSHKVHLITKLHCNS